MCLVLCTIKIHVAYLLVIIKDVQNGGECICIWRFFFINERWKGSNISIPIHIKILFTARIFLYLHRAYVYEMTSTI